MAARFNASDVDKVLIEVELWLVDPLGKMVDSLFVLFKEIRNGATLFVWLLLNRTFLNLSGPPRMPLNFLPINSFDWVLLEHLLNKIIELVGEPANDGHLLHNYLLDELLQGLGIERWLTCGHFDHDAAERPKI